MKGKICDMHCHILPGVDDGAKTMEETMQTLQEAYLQGVDTIIATPHFHPGRYVVNAEQIQSSCHEVIKECHKAELPIRIYPGQECLYYTGLLEELDKGTALTLAGSRYVLVEFEPDCLFTYMLQGLEKVQYGGYIPILAHFERYACLQNREHLKTLKQHGFLLQMNFDRLRQKNSLLHRNQWRKLVSQGIVDFLGSDCHGTHYRAYQLEESCRWLEKQLDPVLRSRILEDNIQKILNKR